MNYFIQPLSTFLTANMPNVDIGEASEGVVNISEAISKYGLAVVIMAVFFVIFMILIVIMLYSNTRMINQIISSKSESDKQDQSIISKFVDSALDAKGVSGKDEIVDTLSHELKESLLPITKQLESMANNTMDNNNDHEHDHKDDYHRDIVGAYIDINMVFKDISRATLNNLGCDRVAIYVFHNGNKSMLGLPFFKMSCIHEWTLHGSGTLRGKSHTDMPLHLFNDFVENLYKYGFYRSENVKNAVEEDPSLNEFMAFSNTKSFYMVGIYGNNNTLTGFVCAEFNNIETFDSDEKRNTEVRSIIDNMVLKISPIVGNEYIFHPNKDHN